MTITVCNSEFMGAYPHVDLQLPEVAFIGRSNVGKSSFINRLLSRKALARTSRTPGRTQEVNIFECELKLEEDQRLKLALADLPGFGFAKVSKGDKEKLAILIADYLMNREPLRAVFLLNDIRRSPQEEELLVRQTVYDRDIPLILTLTKADKLKRGQQAKQREKIAEAYGLEGADCLMMGEKLPVDVAWERIISLL